MAALAAGSTIAGRYRIERLLARGGMGSVWVARHLQLDVPVAVKLMDPSCASDPDARMRFEREAKAAAMLDSPHVVRVHDYGVESGCQFLVMELLQGEDLGARLRREPILPISETAALLGKVCKALRCAHEAGLVHRDLKPGNVFLARQQDDVIVKVLDFGIAKSASAAEATKTGMILGSPHYMSPEQARNSKHVDLRSDLWSVGVIAFRCLTGRLPFPGDELTEVLLAICAGSIPVASQVAPHLGPEVDRFFERALSRDPSRRFQSAQEMAEALSSMGGGARTNASPGAINPSGEHRSGSPPPSPQLAGTLAATGKTLPPFRVRRTSSWIFILGAVPVAAVTSTLTFFQWRSSQPGRAVAPTPSPEPAAEVLVPSVTAAPASTLLEASTPAPVTDGGDDAAVQPSVEGATNHPIPKSAKSPPSPSAVKRRDPRLGF